MVRKQDKCVPHAVPAHTKRKRANQRAKLAIMGRTMQKKDKQRASRVDRTHTLLKQAKHLKAHASSAPQQQFHQHVPSAKQANLV